MLVRRRYPLSNKHSNTFERFNEFVKKGGERGLNLLIIFKNIKSKVIDELNKEHDSETIEKSMSNINSECIELAKQIFSKGGDQPTEEDIQKLVNEITKTL